MRILIAEDNDGQRYLLKKILGHYGICDTVGNGREALGSFLARHENQDPYGVIVLDIGMPEMPGDQALKEIREWEANNSERTSNPVKIIMATAETDPETMLEVMDKRVTYYLIKPYDKEKVDRVFKEFILDQ